MRLGLESNNSTYFFIGSYTNNSRSREFLTNSKAGSSYSPNLDAYCIFLVVAMRICLMLWSFFNQSPINFYTFVHYLVQFTFETSNDIIAGNGRILKVYVYCVVIFVWKYIFCFKQFLKHRPGQVFKLSTSGGLVAF